MIFPADTRTLLLEARADDPLAARTLRALASEPRLKILELLANDLLNTSEIAAALGVPLSTATLHVNLLEEAGLVVSERKPATRGQQKVSARAFDALHVRLPQRRADGPGVLELAMPIGAYTGLEVAPTCGLVGDGGVIGLLDDPTSFYEPERLGAQLLWFRRGFVEYSFPNRVPAGAELTGVSVSLEVCSEAPLHHDPWPSDITVWVGGLELGTWTSPADFGGQRGVLTPAWWESSNSQYGLLKVWKVTPEGTFIDGVRLSDLTVAALQPAGRALTVRVGVKETARHVGGLNLFGRRFGNYPQDVVLKMQYR